MLNLILVPSVRSAQVPLESIERAAGLLIFDKIDRASFRCMNGRKSSWF